MFCSLTLKYFIYLSCAVFSRVLCPPIAPVFLVMNTGHWFVGPNQERRWVMKEMHIRILNFWLTQMKDFAATVVILVQFCLYSSQWNWIGKTATVLTSNQHDHILSVIKVNWDENGWKYVVPKLWKTLTCHGNLVGNWKFGKNAEEMYCDIWFPTFSFSLLCFHYLPNLSHLGASSFCPYFNLKLLSGLKVTSQLIESGTHRALILQNCDYIYGFPNDIEFMKQNQ